MVGYGELTRRFGTPSYVYDLADVRHAHADLVAALPRPSALLYSLKANPHPDVASQLAKLGCRAEISSGGELDVALASGFSPASMLYTGPGKRSEDLADAVRRGVRRFSVDSPVDLKRVAAAAGAAAVEVECLLRINADEPVPGMGLSMTGVASQFGADASLVSKKPEAFRGLEGAPVRGLHLYMGSGIEDETVLMRQFETALCLVRQVSEALRVPLREVDLGGGFGTPFARTGDRPVYATLAERLRDRLDRELPGWTHSEPAVSFESGRYLVGGCGTLLARVLDVKVSKGRTFVVLDTGVNHLGGMSGLRRVPRVVPDLLPDAPPSSWQEGCSVVGPLCTPLDILSQGVRLPRLEVGDVVRIPNVGAYGLTASLLAFLGHAAPTEIVLDRDRIVSASHLELHRRPIAGRFLTSATTKGADRDQRGA